jgi:hypothetical protein
MKIFKCDIYIFLVTTLEKNNKAKPLISAFIIIKAPSLGVNVKKNDYLCASYRIKLDYHFKLRSNSSISPLITAELELPSPVPEEFIANYSAEIVSSINSSICKATPRLDAFIMMNAEFKGLALLFFFQRSH